MRAAVTTPQPRPGARGLLSLGLWLGVNAAIFSPGPSPVDTIRYAAVLTVLLVTACAASAMPVVCALAVAPVEALRAE